MARTKQSRQFTFDATRPLYAAVGVADLTVEFARTAATDVSSRFAKVDLEPKALRDQARTLVVTRVDELSGDAKEAQARLESTVSETVTGVSETYGDLAQRGKQLIARIRRQQATQDAKAAGRTTVAKAKTTKTQTTKSAQQSTGTAKQSASNTGTAAKKQARKTGTAAKKTGATAKRNAKATGTSAKKTASATSRATASAGQKVGD